MLTPLPGSEDHKVLYEKGTWLDPDLNRYDLEHTTIAHPIMSPEVWQQTYEDIWDWYYTDEHVETLMRRNMAYGIKPVRVWRMCLQIYGAMRFEGVHPQQCGYFRLKDPEQRRPGFKRLAGCPALSRVRRRQPDRSICSSASMAGNFTACANASRRTPRRPPTAISRSSLVEGEEENLEMFSLNEASRAAVAKAKRQKEILEKTKHEDAKVLEKAQ
jgi:hypothetical protein